MACKVFQTDYVKKLFFCHISVSLYDFRYGTFAIHTFVVLKGFVLLVWAGSGMNGASGLFFPRVICATRVCTGLYMRCVETFDKN
jgi:hypothetical protein